MAIGQNVLLRTNSRAEVRDAYFKMQISELQQPPFHVPIPTPARMAAVVACLSLSVFSGPGRIKLYDRKSRSGTYCMLMYISLHRLRLCMRVE